MYYTLVLALPLCAYAAAPDYLGAYSNNLRARNMMVARLNMKNRENFNHVMLAGAILKVADAVTNAEYLYSYIYERKVREAIIEAQKYPEFVSTSCNYRIVKTEALSMKAQALVEEFCLPRVLGASALGASALGASALGATALGASALEGSAQCNEAVDEAVKNNNLQRAGDLFLALGDAGYVYLSMAPEFDEVAKRNAVPNYLRNGKGRLADLVMKIANVNKNL